MRTLFTLTLCIGLMLCSTLLSAQRYSMVFDENKGQWDDRALFKSAFPGGEVFLQQDGLRYLFINEEAISDYLHHPPKPNLAYPVTVQSHVIAVDFFGANPKPEVKGSLQYSYYSNYFLGNDPTHWASDVKSYGMVTYQELYPKIDLEFIGNGNSLKYQYRLNPGAKAEDIKLHFRGQEAMLVNEGELVIKTSFHEFREAKPYAYQMVDGEQKEVEAQFEIQGDIVSYKLGEYRKDLPVVIDPVLIFCTYSGTTADNFGFTAAYDSLGNFYAGGNVRNATTIAGGKYPATPGAFQTAFQGGGSPGGTPTNVGFPCDVAISKYDSSGSNLIWASYLGGEYNDYPHSLIVNSKEELVVFGTTFSQQFPTSRGAYDSTFNGKIDIFVTKFAADGKSLIGSTYVGGSDYDGFIDQGNTAGGLLVEGLVFNYADNYRGDVNLHPSTDHIFVASASQSSDFPTAGNPFQPIKSDSIDGVILELNENLSSLIWSTYVGGRLDDALYSIKFNAAGDIYVAGGTASPNLNTSTDAYRKTYGGGRADGFFARVDYQNRNLKYLSYFGSTDYDQIYFCDLDLKGRFYIYGQTASVLARSAGAYGRDKGGMFVSIFDSSLKTIEYQTTFGNQDNNPNLSPTAFVVDLCDKVYMAGWGSDFSIYSYHPGSSANMPLTPDAMQSSTDGEDFYLIVLDKNLQSLVYSTYFGGTQSADHVDGGTSRFNKDGIVYHSICGSCPPGGTTISDITTTPGAVFPINTSPRCSNTSFKIDFQLKSAVQARFSPNPTVACIPASIDMINTSKNGEQFIWNFGDGSAEDTTFSPSHTYTLPGTYTIRLVAIDSNTCNIYDTAYRTVILFDKGTADFDFSVNPCTNLVTFENTSTNAFSYHWDFGNGDTSVFPAPARVFGTGSYNVQLIINPGTFCADTLNKSVDVAEILRDSLRIPNVFTPGTDGFNDCYRFEGLLDCDKIEVEVFSRHSLTVYKTDDNNFCWDGTDKDTHLPLPAGVYYIVASIHLNNMKPFTYRGTITIIR
ncbi:MAG: PKD domain-containing protein [Bacteroidetes bacterium]|nr:MAG: PKD domain-containing protein [Bacteroidota bacterium]